MLETFVWIVCAVAAFCAFPFVYIWIQNIFIPPVSNYTIDGGNLCPRPNMTDEDLYDFEADSFHDIKPENRTWPKLTDFMMYQDRKSVVMEAPLEGELLYPELEVTDNDTVIATTAWLRSRGIPSSEPEPKKIRHLRVVARIDKDEQD
ncbi:hypothetical protein Peetri_00077 [Pseudomonas phage vB_PpuM-Peetri]